MSGVKQPAASSDSTALPSHVPCIPCIIDAQREQSSLNLKIFDPSPDERADVCHHAPTKLCIAAE